MDDEKTVCIRGENKKLDTRECGMIFTLLDNVNSNPKGKASVMG